MARPFPEIKTTLNLRLVVGSFITYGLYPSDVLSTVLVRMKNGSVHSFFLLKHFCVPSRFCNCLCGGVKWQLRRRTQSARPRLEDSEWMLLLNVLR